MPENHQVLVQNAAKVWNWFQTRGGIAIWNSIDLSDPAASWTTPLRNVDGTPATKPTWKAANEPARIITDPAEVTVALPVLRKRFHVAVRLGSQGLKLKVTDGGSRRIRAELEKAGKGSWYEFDYETQEALIYSPSKVVPITEWIAQQGAA